MQALTVTDSNHTTLSPADRMRACHGMTDLTHAERIILAEIAYHDGPGGCFPSRERIAEYTGQSISAVSAYIGQLQKKAG